MQIRFLCPECDTWNTTEQVDAGSWSCGNCNAVIAAARPTAQKDLSACRRCGNGELYVQKDFPHWLGMSILVAACLASVWTYARMWIVATWAILIGSAALDVVLYLIMGNVTVCYRCRTQHRGFAANSAHAPFELAVAERYRQERLRRERLERE